MKEFSSWTMLILRVSLGFLFFYAGVSKFGNFTAKGYLLNLEGPFSALFKPLAGNFLVDQLVIWGLTLIGISLMLGILVRFSSFWGIILMLLLYLSGYPPQHAFIVDDHIIYIAVLLVFMTSNVGHFMGLDKALEKKLPKYKSLMG